MFATLSKNFLAGYGWATSYGEKIPFNPDISTGPTLWIPAAVMIALFGTQTWTAAMTGTVMNIALLLLLVWQLRGISKNRYATPFAVLLAIGLFSVNDFKTFTAYYTTALLLVFSLLFVFNRRYRSSTRLVLFGAAAAIGFYAKPLILLSFLCAFPVVICCFRAIEKTSVVRAISLVLLAFFVTAAPWHIYKTVSLSRYGEAFESAYHQYQSNFFKFHGSGIGQLEQAVDPATYLTKNTRKNFRIFKRYLTDEYRFNVYAFAVILLLAIALPIWKMRLFSDSSTPLPLQLFLFTFGVVALGNILWYLVISFAMTAGHAFFVVFYGFLLMFLLVAEYSHNSAIGVALCAMLIWPFQPRHEPLLEAYSFHQANRFNDTAQTLQLLEFLQSRTFEFPLASCGYNAAPWRMEFLLPGTQNFLDCYNALEDSLKLDEARYVQENPQFASLWQQQLSPVTHFFTSGQHHSVAAHFEWVAPPNFTFVFEGFGVLGALGSQAYVLKPILEECQKHILYQTPFYTVCEVRFHDIRDQLDPTETARQLVDYQQWYRTRLKLYPR